MYFIFTITIIAIFSILKLKLAKAYYLSFDDLVAVENNLKDLTLRVSQLKEENANREKIALKMMNMYEITKDICKFLDEEKIFLNFREGLGNFVKFEECDYLSSIDSRSDLADFEVFPLISDSDNYGYLAVRGLPKDERLILDILIGQFITSIKRARLYEQVQELAITDSLTKVFTRRYSLDRFEEELRRSGEFNLSMSFLMIDIDNFKSFNDKYGHLVGDAILKSAADIIKLNCREIDLIGRYGGEEFMVIMPMTSKDGGLFAAERIRKSLESKQIRAFDELLKVTLSIGVASFPQDAGDCQDLIDKADWALYRSKQTGKNKVSAYAKYEQ